MSITATTPTNFRKNLASFLDDVVGNNTEVILTRENGNAVVISEDSWNSVNETLYLLSNKSNREHLERSIEQLEGNEMDPFLFDEFDQLTKRLLDENK